MGLNIGPQQWWTDKYAPPQRSLRFNSSDSAYLSRTPASAGNRKTWTWAGWVKRTAIGASQQIFGGNQSTNPYTIISFQSDDTIRLLDSPSSSRYNTQAVFRDTSSWYHIVFSCDTTQATQANRFKIYVNGTESPLTVTSAFAQDYSTQINTTTEHRIGRWLSTFGNYLNGYLADIHFIDGQALDPTSFGEFDDNGIWQPIAYSGSYGTNGFHLPFDDNSTAAALGTDTSGNSNTWTVNNISVTAGAGNDSLVDVPTNGTETDTGVGGEVRGNYATWNPLFDTYATDSNTTWANGNLEASATNRNWTVSSIGFNSGKWYAEFSLSTFSTGSPTGGILFGVSEVTVAATANPGPARSSDSNGYSSLGNIFNNNSFSIGFATFGVGDIIGVAVDITSNTVDYYKNGSLVSSRSHTFDTSKTYVFGTANEANVATSTIVANFGQRPFAYTAPSGFKALCTANLPDPVVTKPSEYMDVKLYTGNGSTQTISGLEFSPDLVWIKVRSTGYGHRVFDTVRGTGGLLYTNATDAEVAQPNATDNFSSFNSDGFSLGAGIGLNENNSTYAAWTWDAGSSTVTNTDGSITSSVRANPSAGFSICQFTCPASGGWTFGHGLNVAPQFVVMRSTGITSNWHTYHVGLSAISTGRKFIWLNSTSAEMGSSNTYWTSDPSSTIVSVGSGLNPGSSQAHIAYCFAPVDGYSSFGSYTGNGSADGPFVYTGFRPRWVLVKRAVGAIASWVLHDTARSPYNVSLNRLFPNSSNAEVADATMQVDCLSNGFKIRGTGGNVNGSGDTYIYAAFSEAPFQYARAR